MIRSDAGLQYFNCRYRGSSVILSIQLIYGGGAMAEDNRGTVGVPSLSSRADAPVRGLRRDAAVAVAVPAEPDGDPVADADAAEDRVESTKRSAANFSEEEMVPACSESPAPGWRHVVFRATGGLLPIAP